MTPTPDNGPREPQYRSAGFFALRTPLLPFDQFLAWGDGLQAVTALEDPALLETALVADRTRLRERLRALLDRPLVRDALFVASPDLDESREVWIRDPDGERGTRIERAIVRYFSRMAGRATPFGLFAGTSVGGIGDRTRLVLEGAEKSRRHSRLDMDYLFVLVETLARDPALRGAFDFRPSSSLYRAAGRVHYVEARLDKKERSHHLVAVDDTDALRGTLERAAAGGTGSSASALAQALSGDDVSPDEARDYIGALIDGQILRPDLALLVTGDDPAGALAARLAERPETASIAARLEHVRTSLASLDVARPGVDPAFYRDVAKQLADLPAPVELARLVQVDLFKASPEATLGGAVLEEIARGAEMLRRLHSAPRRGALTLFLDAFTARYEEREMPLVDVLDPEKGIGYPPETGLDAGGGPLLAGIDFPASGETSTWEARDELLLRRLTRATSDGHAEIVLTARELEKLAAGDPPPLPGAFAVMASVAASSEEAMQRGDFRVLLTGLDGPSGARLLGRFCHGDPALHRLVQEHLRAEEALDPDAVFAEVVHQPEGRLGNILFRPVLREYEIPYLGGSGAAIDRQIPVTDLLVSISGGRLILRSARLGRRIVPRLTSAHNFRNGLPLYRFLCDLQGDGTAASAGWDWGALGAAAFLPRVSSGRIVLSPARWNAYREELEPLGRAHGAERFRRVQTWRAARRLPRLLLLADGDNRLPVDLDNVLSVESFVALVKDREQAALLEMFPGPDEICACGPEGRFLHELIVPFVRTPGGDPISVPVSAPPNAPPGDKAGTPWVPSPATRSFPPGSEWLYAKLYGGVSSADRVLLETVAPLVREALASGAADRWFFIRYADPEAHVRVRLHGSPERLLGEVLPALHAALVTPLAEGRLWKVQLDTYEREVERYGGPEGVRVAEEIFEADSEAVLAILEGLEEGDEGSGERWRLAVRGIDMLFDDFGLSAEERLALIRRSRESLGRDFRVDAGLKRQLGDRYRKESPGLRTVLDPEQDGESALLPGIEAFRRRSERIAPLVVRLKEEDRAGRLAKTIPALAGSYVHMHVNRMLRSAQRAQELVLYDFLRRAYDERRAVRAREDAIRPR